MTKTLRLRAGRTVLLAPTTTAKLAERMLVASQVLSDHMPPGLYGTVALDIMLVLHVEEERSRYLHVNELLSRFPSLPSALRRWITALVSEGLVEERNERLALTQTGYETVAIAIEAVFAAQRALD